MNTIRYVEANPVRAGLVSRAELWPWSSLNERLRDARTLDLGPVALPTDDWWLELVNATQRQPVKRQRRRTSSIAVPPGE